MKNSIYDKIATLAPVNKESRLTTSVDAGKEARRGYDPHDSEDPLPMRPLPSTVTDSLIGLRNGRLTVLGLAEKLSSKPKWVCRCDCGTYTFRRSVSIRNPMNTHDSCGWCRRNAYLKKEEVYYSPEDRLRKEVSGTKESIENSLKGFERKYINITKEVESHDSKEMRLGLLEEIKKIISELENR